MPSCWDCVALNDTSIGMVDVESGRLLWNFNRTKWRIRTSDLMESCQACPYIFICRGGCASRAKNAYGSFFREYCGEIKEIFSSVAPLLAKKQWEQTQESELTLSLTVPLSKLSSEDRQTLMTATDQKAITSVLDKTKILTTPTNNKL